MYVTPPERNSRQLSTTSIPCDLLNFQTWWSTDSYARMTCLSKYPNDFKSSLNIRTPLRYVLRSVLRTATPLRTPLFENIPTRMLRMFGSWNHSKLRAVIVDSWNGANHSLPGRYYAKYTSSNKDNDRTRPIWKSRLFRTALLAGAVAPQSAVHIRDMNHFEESNDFQHRKRYLSNDQWKSPSLFASWPVIGSNI